MNSPTRVAAGILHSDRRVLAEWIAAESEASFGMDGRSSADWVAEIEFHIDTLAACVEFSSPRLLRDYWQWHRALDASNSVAEGELALVYEALIDVAANEIPPASLEIIRRFIAAGRSAAAGPSPEVPSSRTSLRALEAYLAAVLAADRSEAQKVVFQALHSGMPIADIYGHILQPAQYEIGRLWQAGEISVAQEHFCTSVTQLVLSQLQPYFLRKTPGDKTLVAACVGDELHEVGLRFVADLLEMAGWSTSYLGASAPAEDIAALVADQQAQILAVSTTLTRNLFSLAELIEVVRSTPGCEDVRIVVGGYPFNVDPFLWRRLGADGYALDANDAIELCNRFVDQDRSIESFDVGEGRTKSSAAGEPSASDRTAEEELSRLNNELVTAHRELTRANLQLQQVNQELTAKTEALEQTDRQKDEFLAMLAHELRGPLAPIQLAANVLQIELQADAKATEAVQTIDRQIKHLSRLVSDLLDASRIAHGKIELKKAPASLDSILKRALEIARPLVTQKNQQITVTNRQPSLRLEADEIRLTQVIANLLTNASRYTSDAGQIWVTADLEEDQAVIEVRDDGIGIEEETLPHIFETFTQESRARQHAAGGLGLGLSLVKQLVELHLGEVEARSCGPGAGAAFVVRLPALGSAGQPSSGRPAPEGASSLLTTPRRILVVDDAAGSAKITAHLLEILGHEAAVARDGASAMRCYEQLSPEIVILDVIMPDMSGMDLARRIRSASSKPPLLVALTGNDSEELREEADEAGFDAYLVKPIAIDQLQDLAAHPKLDATRHP